MRQMKEKKNFDRTQNQNWKSQLYDMHRDKFLTELKKMQM
jgi:hypothetical protein